MSTQKHIWFMNYLPWIFAVLLAVLYVPSGINAQDQEEGIFWGDEEGQYQEEYYGEEDTAYYEGEEYYGEEDTSYYGEEEYYGEEDTSYYGEEYLYGAGEEEELTDLEFAEEAERRGYTAQISVASPWYVNHALEKWNSFIDFRLDVHFPLLMELGPLEFRFGVEIATFSFENSLPVGGKFGGVGFLGLLSFPAGPSTADLGLGILGSSPAFIVGQSYGISIANVLDLRIGFRSTTAINLPDDFKDATRAQWFDLVGTVGYTF